MEMDDPWGSPWADEIQIPNTVKPREGELAVKPTTPVKAAILALEQKTNSPWDDPEEDGFGDWTAGSAEDEEDGDGLGLDKNDGWGSETGNGLEHGMTDRGLNALSVAWKDGAVTSEDGMSKLAPRLLPMDGIVRQPSPDRWAVDTTREDRNGEAPPLQVEQHDSGDTDHETITGMSTEEGVAADVVPVVVADEALPGAIGSERSISIANFTDEIVEESNKTKVENLENLTPIETSVQNRHIQEAEHVSSRPSSSPSEHSHHDKLVQDSPRTSLDEEQKRPQILRKVSKVQEFVQHFDGLARQGATEPIIGRAGSLERTQENEEAEEVDDFGDFEDVQSEIEEPLEEVKADSLAKSPIIDDSNTSTREIVEQGEPRTRVTRKDFGPVEFIVDISAFDRLYSGTQAKSPLEKLFISDTVPHDSFSTTEERKTWYRISRYGTMRKYNSGADENYVRVNWAQSQVRAETLKIVARWIEEDRISGRVVLGGASKGSSIFGWNDSKAAPVSLAHAFPTKNGKQKVMPAAGEPAVEIPREWPKGLVRTRSTSRSPSLSKSRRKSSTKSTTSEEAKQGTQVPVANFGWNAVPQDVQESKPQSPVHGKKLSGSSFSSPPPAMKMSPAPQPTSSRIYSSLPIEPVKRVTAPNGTTPRPHSIAHANISVTTSLPTSNLTNDDDDWGELVSSPSSNIPPVIPTSTGSHHKAIRSLGSAFPSTTPTLPVTKKSTSTLKSVETDRWAMGLDGSLTPQTTNSMNGSMPETFSENTFTASNDCVKNPFGPAAQTANKPPAANNIDPWASADFSFFETTPFSKATPAPITKTMPPKSITFNTRTASSVPYPNQKSREEIEQDRVVQSVIKMLPDFSYMLRR